MYGKPKPASHNSTSYINKPIRIFATKKEHPSHLYQVNQASSIIPHLWPICLKRKPNNLHKIHCIPFSKSPNTIWYIYSNYLIFYLCYLCLLIFLACVLLPKMISFKEHGKVIIFQSLKPSGIPVTFWPLQAMSKFLTRSF